MWVWCCGGAGGGGGGTVPSEWCIVDAGYPSETATQ